MKKYLIGNMKMNQCYSVLEKYFDEIKEIAEHTDNYVGVCVPNVYLNLAKDKLAGSKVHYGVENVYHQDKGAYTGEVSVDMLKDFDTELVIVGHSERRQMFGDTDKEVNKKVKTKESIRARGNKFHNFQQREYDYDELERRLTELKGGEHG